MKRISEDKNCGVHKNLEEERIFGSGTSEKISCIDLHISPVIIKILSRCSLEVLNESYVPEVIVIKDLEHIVR